MSNKEQQDEKHHISKSVFQTNKEMQEKAAEEERARQEELRRKLEERRKKAAEARDKRLEEERLELLRLKTGVIEESEIIHEEEPEEIHQTFGQKIGSFFYLNKWWLGICTMIALIAVFLTVNLLSKPRPDMIVLLIGDNYVLGEESQLQSYIESFTPDNNNNGKILASVYYIPYTDNERDNYVNSVPSKLTAELQSADSVIIIGNKLITDVITPENVLTDLSELYPDNEHVDKYKFMLSDTDFAEKVGVPADIITDDWFIAIRKPQELLYSKKKNMEKTYDKDFPTFDAIIRDLSE